MAYVFLLGAIAAEVIATAFMKSTEGFTRLWPTVAVLGGYAISFVLLAQAVKGVQVSVAYALWSALGTAAIVAIGAAFLNAAFDICLGCEVHLRLVRLLGRPVVRYKPRTS